MIPNADGWKDDSMVCTLYDVGRTDVRTYVRTYDNKVDRLDSNQLD